MLTRVSAYLSLLIGVWGALAALTVLGAGAGGALGALALLCGGAALTERPRGHVRRAAWVGVVTGACAVAALFVWIGLALLGV